MPPGRHNTRPKEEPEEPWLQLPSETREAYAAFKVYRDLDDKEASLHRVASEQAKSLVLMKRWSKRHAWVERRRLWQAHLDRERQLAQVEEARQMGRRQAEDARALQRVLMEPARAFLRRLALLTEKARMGDLDANAELAALHDASLPDLFGLSILGARAFPRVALSERLARGEPTEIPALPVSPLAPASMSAEEDQIRGVLEAWAEAGVLDQALNPPLEEESRDVDER